MRSSAPTVLPTSTKNKPQQRKIAPLNTPKNIPGKKSVFCTLNASITAVDMVNESFSVEGYLKFFFQYPHMAKDQRDLGNSRFKTKYSEQELLDDGHTLPLSTKSMWANQTPTSMTLLKSWAGFDEETGIGSLQYQFATTFCEEFELVDFPFDRQLCHMVLNVRRGMWAYFSKRPEWVPEKEWGRPVVCCTLTLAPCTYSEYDFFSPYVKFPDEDNEKDKFVKPTFIACIERKTQYYLLNLVLPTFCIGGCSLTALLPSLGNYEDRLSVTTTMLLTGAAFKIATATYLPKINYATRMDLYLLSGTFALTSLVMVINAAKSLTASTSTDEIATGSATSNSSSVINELLDDFQEGGLDAVALVILSFCWILFHLVLALAIASGSKLLYRSWRKVGHMDTVGAEMRPLHANSEEPEVPHWKLE